MWCKISNSIIIAYRSQYLPCTKIPTSLVGFIITINFVPMIDKLKKQIDKVQNIVLLGHKNPDGDAIGSTMAFKGVLQHLGKKVDVIFPNKYPDYLGWIKGLDESIIFDDDTEKALATLAAAEFVIMLDFNSLIRIDQLGEHIPNVPVAMIDHHPYPDVETPMLFSDTSVSSTCELLTDILYQMQYDCYIEKDEATALFVGIITDTGRFNHNSSNPRTFRMVANLLDKGVDKDGVFDRIFDCFSEKRIRLLGYILNEKMLIYPEQGISIIALSMKEKESFGFKSGDAEGFVNYPLSVVGIGRSIFMQESDDRIRMSFRSKDIAVNTVASEHFNGGGHAKAAGGTSFASLDETVAKVKEIFGITE